MGAAGRANDRAAQRSGKSVGDYKYNPQTNTATLKEDDCGCMNESVELNECWDTHVQKGYKMKGGKRVPNCVPRNEEETRRDYKKEYANYHSKPEQRANRSKRVLARRKLEKEGRVQRGDGKDVDHKDGNPQNNSNGNLRVMSANKNRGRDNNKWRK